MAIGKKDAANLLKCADIAESQVVELSNLLADPKSAGQAYPCVLADAIRISKEIRSLAEIADKAI